MTPIIMGLIQAAPMLAKWISGDDKETPIVDKAMEIAQALTGQKGKSAVDAINSDPALAFEFQKAVLDNENELNRLAYADRESARNMHKENHKQADDLADHIIRWNYGYIAVTVAVECLAIWFLKEHAVELSAVTSVCTWIIKGALDERRDVTGFYFGSSLGSKLKDSAK
jgi:hypothetical protein